MLFALPLFFILQAKNLSLNKQQFCEDCKNEYASELQKTNGAQREHYDTIMPQIFQVHKLMCNYCSTRGKHNILNNLHSR